MRNRGRRKCREIFDEDEGYKRKKEKERERESPVERNINNKVKRIGKRHARNVKLIQSAKQVEV